jgi:hypothetical protein
VLDAPAAAALSWIACTDNAIRDATPLAAAVRARAARTGEAGLTHVFLEQNALDDHAAHALAAAVDDGAFEPGGRRLWLSSNPISHRARDELRAAAARRPELHRDFLLL